MNHLIEPTSESAEAGITCKPPAFAANKVLIFSVAFFVVGMALLGPHALAQSSGAAPIFGATVQGQSASTVEGTLANVMNYFGNVLCPIGAAGMVGWTIMQIKSGKSWGGHAATAVGLLAVSGVTRLIESMVTNGQASVR